MTKKPEDLAVKPVLGAAKPEFPKRDSLYRRAGLLGGVVAAGLSTVACGGTPAAAPTTPSEPVAAAEPVAQPTPTPDDKPVESKLPDPEPVAPTPPPEPEPLPPPPPVAHKDGSVDGKPIDAAFVAPKFKVYRDGGGIGPPEDMWEPSEVEAFLSYTMAKEGKLNLKSAYKFEHEGTSLVLDAYDADKKIGYAYVDRWDEDAPIAAADVKKLDAWMKAKKVAILYIDMKKVPDQATLKGKIVKFLADVKKAPPAP